MDNAITTWQDVAMVAIIYTSILIPELIKRLRKGKANG